MRSLHLLLLAVPLACAFGCEAPPSVVPHANVLKVAPRARVVAPEGWDRSVLLAVLPYLASDEAQLAMRRFELTGVIELSWSDAVADALDGARGELLVEWVRPNRSRIPRPTVGRNIDAADTSNIDALLPGGATGFNLTGVGVLLGEWDEGAPRVSHREFVGRVRVGDGAGPVEHSTQVAGTMVATGVTAAARGMAVGASLVAHDWDVDTLELYDAGPTLAATNHSYGAILGWDSNSACDDLPSWVGDGNAEDPAFGKYMADARAIDAVIYARDLLSVWAAGNERQDTGATAGQAHYHWPSCSRTYNDSHASEAMLRFDTLGGQPTLKNGLVVGAVRDVLDDPQTTASIVVEAYSSCGPMDDGRIKPDLVANGESVRSSDASADDAYSTASGTSLATPVVTGALALLTQKYRQVNAQRDPRAAELKALVLHTAMEVGAAPGPDYEAGFGLLDARAAAELLDADRTRPLSSRQLRAGALAAASVETHLTTDVVAPGTSLRVTLVWHDPAGVPNVGGTDDGTPALVNDLDVVLVAPDQQSLFYPWRLRSSDPTAAATRAGPNRVDNVERVDVDGIDNVWNGRWSVRVSANGALSPRGHAQAYGLASSVALEAPGSPVLGAPRTLLVEAPFGATPANISVPLANLGGGALTWSLSETLTWLTPSATVGSAPDGFDLAFDVGQFTQPGDYGGVIEIDSSDASGPHTIGVTLRLTCTPDCSGRVCGIDALCGVSCGRCLNAQACSAVGSCIALQRGCPAATLGSQLGVVAQGSTAARTGTTLGSCGGANASDVAFEWTAPTAGRYDFTTLGSDYDTVLYLRDAACNGPELACNDDSGGVASTVSAMLSAGQHVFVVIDGYNGPGEFVLTISRGTCPSTDLGSALGDRLLDSSTVGAVNKLAAACGGALAEELAVRWTAPADAQYRFTTADSDDDNDTVLYVLDGTCEGCPLACADTPNPVSGVHATETLLLDLKRDQTVVVVIDGRGVTDVGGVKLGIARNDDRCEGACGASPNGTCFCDAECLAAGDCCPDACASCGHCQCVAECSGRACGDDGCGGTCGTCTTDERCELGSCVVDPCAGVACGVCEACIDGGCAALPEYALCDDGSNCTAFDRCIRGLCVGASILCDDGDACTDDLVDEARGVCRFNAIAGCCNSDRDCDDSDICTTDSCEVVSRTCRHQARVSCCVSSSECNDGDPCTVDACLLGGCFHGAAAECDATDGGDIGAGDASDLGDASWSDATVRGGGCNCAAAGSEAPTSHPSALAWLLLLPLGVRGRRRVRSSPGSRAAVAASRFHRPR